MPRLNFHSLSSDPRKVFEREFTDPRHPGEVLLLKLEEPDALTDYAAAEAAQELVRRYLEGNAELGMAAQPFLVDGEPKVLTELLCDDIARVVEMQPATWEDRYQPEEVLMMAFKRRGLWLQVRRWAREVFVGAEGALPNASAGRAVDSCDPPSNAESSILASSPISVKHSTASTSGSAAVPD